MTKQEFVSNVFSTKEAKCATFVLNLQKSFLRVLQFYKAMITIN